MLYRYYKVGRFLHFVALFAFTLCCISLYRLMVLDPSPGTAEWYIWLAILFVFLQMTILAELDGYSRFQNYKQVKDQIFINGFQERILKPLSRSSCQREAAILAGEELGIGPLVKNYYMDKGYRWYHIIPDFVFQYPKFFFSAFFWRTTFFTPYYEPRIDFSQYDMSEIDLILKGIQLDPVQ